VHQQLKQQQQPKEDPCLRQDDEKGGADRPCENDELEPERFDDDDDDAQLQLPPADEAKLGLSREELRFVWLDFRAFRESERASW
jgi:hypothetical protein